MRLLVITFLILVTLGAVGTMLFKISSKAVVPKQTVQNELDGVYVFQSRLLTLTSPKESNEGEKKNEWSSIWIFKDGYFSISGMGTDRSNWTPRTFPQTAKDMRFEGKAGKFRVDSNRLTLTNIIAFYPGQIQSTDEYEYEIRDTELVLTRKLISSREDLSSGLEMIVLTRVSD